MGRLAHAPAFVHDLQMSFHQHLLVSVAWLHVNPHLEHHDHHAVDDFDAFHSLEALLETKR